MRLSEKDIPSGISPSKRTIIREYIKLRNEGGKISAREIAIRLGYKLDVNNSSGFVGLVLRQYLKGDYR